jgi:hypothetical protein
MFLLKRTGQNGLTETFGLLRFAESMATFMSTILQENSQVVMIIDN